MIAAVALPLGAAYLLGSKTIALPVYNGLTFMIVAVSRLPVSRLAVVGACVAAATGLGILVAGSLPLLLLTVAVACLAQWLFNGWGIATAALLPAIPAAYAFTRSPDLVLATAWTLAGAALAIAVASLVKIRSRAERAESEVAGPTPRLSRSAVWP